MLTSDQITVNVCSTKQKIEWKFYSQSHPLDGRTIVGLTKRTLHKTIGNKCLTEKELVTVLAEIETLMNSHHIGVLR